MTDATDDRDDELLARLWSVDPASSLPPADPAWVARLLEDTMTDVEREGETVPTRETGTHGRNPLTWLVAAAAVLIIAGVGAFGLLAHDSGDKVPGAGSDPVHTVTHLSAAPGGSSGKCMVPNADLLGTQTLAFAGTVQEFTGGVVTLVPTHFYAGDVTDVVEIEVPSADMHALVGAVQFEDGGRYLVSATGGRVTVCGFSGPVTPELTALYEQAFPT
jgi:hypothetical protein